MKIIQVIPLLEVGGAETMCENLTYALRDLGHEVIVISLYDHTSLITERMMANRVDIRYLHKRQGMDISLFSKLESLFAEEKPDVVHTHLYAAKYAFVAAKAAKIKCIVHTLHSIAAQESTRTSRCINRFFFKNDYAVPVALSELVQSTIVDEYKINANKIPIIYNGVPLSKCQVKSDYSIRGSFKILHIGRFADVKNHAGLIEAFDMFHKKHQESELQLIGDGERFDEMKQLVKQRSLDGAVRFLGKQSNVFGYLHEADIFVLPSLYEGMPMTLIEAMGTGLPIVATAVGGIPDMLDNSNSQMVDTNSEDIATAFEKYYIDGELRRNHGNKVLDKAVEFSAEKMAQNYYTLYRKVMEGGEYAHE